MEHRTRTIARTRNARIDQCTCGAIHVTVGSTTMRITEAAARELKDALGRGFATIDATDGTAPAPAPRFRVVLPGEDDDGGGQVH